VPTFATRDYELSDEGLRRENGVMSKPTLDIEKLSPDERLELLEELWDSLRKDPSSVPLTPAQREELDRRLDDLEADIESGAPLGIPWNEVMQRIRNRSS
jgi:putative addiction module component (TIGR02574 family)